MTVQDHIVTITEHSVESLFRNARAVPADKLDWKPLDEGRSVLGMLSECATVPRFAIDILTTGVAPEFSEERMAKNRALRETLTTVDACEQLCLQNTNELIQAIRAFPTERLGDTIHLPFGNGMTVTMAQIANMHYWNNVYHIGQIAYIQTLYGDKEWHG
jgi:hypothetical protein